LDPPYYGSVPYRKGIPPFTDADHVDLAKVLAKIHGKSLLTYNDYPRIRELYKDFKISEVATRLNTDKMATADRRSFRQVIIRNY
jgi:DNA adenine methylase